MITLRAVQADKSLSSVSRVLLLSQYRQRDRETVDSTDRETERQRMLLVFFLFVMARAEDLSFTRTMYDSMAQLVGDSQYPTAWWEEREECLALTSPLLEERLELAWLGLLQYWKEGGAVGDVWHSCEQARWVHTEHVLEMIFTTEI